MEGLYASNNTVYVDTTNAVVQLRGLNGVMVSLKKYSTAACTGSGHDDGPLLTALDAASSSYILIDSTNCYVNTTTSLNNTLIFSSGAAINGSGNLTLATVPISQPQKIFNTSGSVAITRAAQPVYAEWWGAYPYPTATTSASLDSAAAFQKADTALTNGGTIRALTGHYRMNSTVTQSNSNLIGDGKWKTVFEPGSALVYYSTMTLFSWNNHYAHYESFQVNSNVVTSSFTVFLSSNGAGGERVNDIQLVNVGRGIDMPVNNAAHLSNLFFNGCSTCIYTGGNSGLFTGDIFWNNLVLLPYTTAGRMGTAWLIDKNSSAFYVSNLTTLGGQVGVWITVTGGGGLTGTDARPSNMLFHRPVINAHTQYGVRIDQALYTTFDDNPVINGMTYGEAFHVDPSTPTFVDGLEIDNALVDGNGLDGVLFNGCNLSILGGNYLANGATKAGVHIGSTACGLVKLQDLMAGTTIWANAANGQKYGVQIDAGALDNKTQPVSGNVFTGRLVMTGLMLGGNVTAPYLDNSTIADARKLIANIQTDLGPNFSYGSNSTAAVFTSSVSIQYELMQSTYTMGQTGEMARFRVGTTQNLVITGAQALASGGSILAENDNNSLAPLQLRGTKLYWASTDGNVGIGNTTPATLLNVSSGIVTIDGSGNGLIVGTGALASGDKFRVVSGSATIDGMLHIGNTIVNNTCLTSVTCTATCTAGTYVTGGGCATNGAGGIYGSFPNSTVSWKCDDLVSSTITAYVVCARSN